MPLVTACRLDALAPGRGRAVRLGGRHIAVFLVDGVVRAVDDRCPHTGGPLADGQVVDGCVICPWHGWVYELRTGEKVVGSHSAGGVGVYEVVVEGNEVKVRIPDEVVT